MDDKMKKRENETQGVQDKAKVMNVSPAVIKRLPRYFRYLRELIREGKLRISSSELSDRMNVTASQIRQDLNCFGGFGQQGYGYNVNYLYTKISELLGVGEGYSAIIVGAGNLGRALARNQMFEKRGVDVVGIFDVDPEIVGREVGELTVSHMDTLDTFFDENVVDIAVLTLPKAMTPDVMKRLAALGVRGIWNFTGMEAQGLCPGVAVENVHLGDSLMTLCYDLRTRGGDKE